MTDDELDEIEALPCLVCGKILPGLSDRDNQPSGGTEFVAEGHYGSTVHDPMDGTRLAINVCDSCLLLAMASKRVGKYEVVSASKRGDRGFKYKVFDGS